MLKSGWCLVLWWWRFGINLADSAKRVFKFQDQATWLQDEGGMGFNRTGLANILPSNIFRLKGPQDELQRVSIGDYLDNMSISHLVLISNLAYNQRYEVMLFHPGTTPAQTDMDVVPLSKLRPILQSIKHLNATWQTTFDELTHSSSSTHYAVGVIIYHRNNNVVSSSFRNTLHLDFHYHFVLAPVYFYALTPDVVRVFILGFIYCGLAHLFLIPRFRAFLLQNSPSHPHAE